MRDPPSSSEECDVAFARDEAHEKVGFSAVPQLVPVQGVTDKRSGPEKEDRQMLEHRDLPEATPCLA